MDINEASSIAEDASFEIIANDSVHYIGKSGGEIIDQNPKPSSMVKENRKVYVTITKFIADQIKVSGLPTLYGRAYDRKKKELSFMDLNCEIKGYKYDPGEPNHILEVYYKGDTIISRSGRKDNVSIEKGSTLQFLLSESSGGDMNLPDVVCMDFQTAAFLIENLRLSIGEIVEEGKIIDQSSSYVISQTPEYKVGALIQIGDEIQITISQEKPTNCN